MRTKKGKWVAYGKERDGLTMYRAARIADTSQPLCDANMDFYGDYSPDKEAILSICRELERGSGENCPDCGSPQLQPSGTCKVCPVCGATTGCS